MYLTKDYKDLYNLAIQSRNLALIMILYNYFADTDFISQILLPRDIIYNLTNNFFRWYLIKY